MFEWVFELVCFEIVVVNDGGVMGVDVFIDGVLCGMVLNSFEVVVGWYNIEVKKVGWKLFVKWVDLVEDECCIVEVVFEWVEVFMGMLLVMVDVFGEVFVDGVCKDIVLVVIFGLLLGEYVVEVWCEGVFLWW